MKRAIVFITIALAIPAIAHGAPRAESADVTRAKTELATARAHMKAARERDRSARKLEHNQARIAKLRAQLAKLECGSCVADSPTSCLCKGGK